ncbi:hypothetical protein AQUCO_07700014v1 [Aquilegia coerulea]|uniref:Protein root UVB sensitive/RUS domain-containing protein n=1 Tax=Aquilegia coerulea TaxID=218851 RepID=A0A2G5C868_AQUCA|nr:hypothetical protein AQUCO_07700014v1 [Aquilegia coerulea]
MMHLIDTIKTRIQSQAIFSASQAQKSVPRMMRTVWATDGIRGFYRGLTPGLTGSLATGATYFGVIESTKKWIEELHPDLGGHWAHFIAGGLGDTLGSFIYVPCEVMKQRMQVQGTKNSWTSTALKETIRRKSDNQMYGYYSGMFQAGGSIWKQQGLRGLYAGYWSTLARDVPFAGLMVTFYEVLKDLTEYGKQKWLPHTDYYVGSSFEGLLLGGLAGGISSYLTTPLDVIKTRLQVQGPMIRYRLNVKQQIDNYVSGVIWYIPASALTFMAVEFLRDHFSGFPTSVTPDYAPFQIWDSLQGLSTYIRMMLSTLALLSAIGVGEKSATVIGATFQWFLRDFTGMLGGILFTFYQGSNLDSNA